MSSASIESLRAEQHFLYLTTIGRVSGQPHEIEIWFILDDEKFYLFAGTNSVESFRTLVKRRILPLYHRVARTDSHQMYLNEFALRINVRKDSEMFEKMLQTVER
jgi:hypothetical protein